MKTKISYLLKNHWSKLLSVSFFILLLGAYVNIFAIDNPFSPGQTLNPNCGPLEANCYIDLNTGGGSNPWLTSSNGIYYDGGGVGVGGSDISINTAVSGGVIWDNIYEEETNSFAVSSEVDSNGNNVSAFYSFGEGTNLTLLICRDESCDDSDSYNIASGISVGEGFTPSPSLKIGSDGSIHIAYISLEPTEGSIETNFFYATCNISGCESPEITPISFSGGETPEATLGYSLALDENDDPYIIFGSVIISEGEEGSGDIFSMMNSFYLNTARYVGSGSGNCGDGDWSCSRITEGMFPGYMGMMGNAGDYAYIDENDGYPRFIANTFNMISESEILFNLEYFKCEDSSCSIYSKDTINSLEISSLISSMGEGDGGTGDMLFYMLLFGSSYIDVDSNNNPAIVFNHLDGSLETEPSFNLSSARYVGSGNGLGCDSSDWNCTNILSTDLAGEEDLLSILMLKDFNIDENDNLGILGIGNPVGSGGSIISLNYLSCLNNSCSSYSISEIVQDEISSPGILFFLGLSSLSISDSGSVYVTHSNYDDGTIKIFKKDELRGISLDENNALYSAGDLGISGNLFVDGSIVTSNGIYLNDGGPSNVNNALYNLGGELYWNGESIIQDISSVPYADEAGSASSLATYRTIFGYSFNGTSNITGTVSPSYGGTGRNTLTSNSLLVGNGTSSVNLIAPGTSGNILTSNGTSWVSSALSIPTRTVAQGGTGLTTLTANNLMVGNGTSNVSFIAPGTSGNILTSNGTSWVSSAPVINLSSDSDFNTKGGTNAGANLSSGAQNNTYLGYEAGLLSSTGMVDNNTAVGSRALYSNVSGSNNTANGAQSLFSNTQGNRNTATGVSALYSNTVGIYNTASGARSLMYNTGGDYNTASGAQSLMYNTGGDYNTANGVDSLYSNTTGNGNTANGYYSLHSNTTGSYNTANGYQSLLSSTTGSYNTANGYQSLSSNTTGYRNTANGDQSLYYSGKAVTAGSFITGVSYTIIATGTTDFTLCGASNSTAGTVFTATGPCSGTGKASSNSNNNVGIGYQSGVHIANGTTALNASSNSIFLGADTKALIDGSSNEIVIGYNAIGHGSNTATWGATSITNHYFSGNVQYSSYGAGTLTTDASGNITTSSDERLKDIIGYYDNNIDNTNNTDTDNITEIQKGALERIIEINPIIYKWNEKSGLETEHSYVGFSAQNLQLAIPEAVGLDKRIDPETGENYLTISDRPILATVVNAIKELNLKVEAISFDEKNSGFFSTILTKIEDGVAYLTNIMVDTITVGGPQKRTGITLYDEETGEPYCITVVNGEMINREGECGIIEVADICPNIDGYQQEIPYDYELNEYYDCIKKSYKEETPAVEEETPAVEEETPAVEEETPAVEEETPAVEEETPAVEEETPAVEEETPAVEEETPAVEEETPAVEEETPAVEEETPAVEEETPIDE